MNNLHRELAPISDAAWAQIEEETARTFKRYLAGRRVVDVQGPAGTALSAVGTGHLRPIAGSKDGVLARQLRPAARFQPRRHRKPVFCSVFNISRSHRRGPTRRACRTPCRAGDGGGLSIHFAAK